MNTTSIVAELLVIGSISLGWLIPLSKSISKFNISTITLNNGDILFTLAIIYLMGIVINYLADKVFFYYDKNQVEKYGSKESIQEIRCKLLLKSAEVNTYMNQKRSIVRIFRASCFNFIIISLFALFSFYDSFINFSHIYLSIIFFLITCILFLGYHHTLNGYFKFIIVMEKIIND